MTSPVSKQFEDVAVGEALPALETAISLVSLVAYAGATWDFHRYHYDGAVAASLGFPGPFMDGQMVGALLARQLMAWGGADAFVRKLSFRLREMVFADETIVITGKVKDKLVDGGRPLALCTLSVAKADGTVVVRDATAAVELASRRQG
jgi:acyl dehydratase